MLRYKIVAARVTSEHAVAGGVSEVQHGSVPQVVHPTLTHHEAALTRLPPTLLSATNETPLDMQRRLGGQRSWEDAPALFEGVAARRAQPASQTCLSIRLVQRLRTAAFPWSSLRERDEYLGDRRCMYSALRAESLRTYLRTGQPAMVWVVGTLIFWVGSRIRD